MAILQRSKPKTITDRAKAAGGIASDAAKAAGNFTSAAGTAVTEVAKTAVDRAVATSKATPKQLDSTRSRALAAAGTVAGAAGAVAFWRSRQDGEPAVTVDPARPEPTSVATTETPEAAAAKANAT